MPRPALCFLLTLPFRVLLRWAYETGLQAWYGDRGCDG